MSYVPIIPMSGYSGWLVLNRTMERQEAAFTASAEYQRTEEYFREKIGSITTAEELVSDRRLLSVALGAFGLDDDINNKYFIRKVLEEGTQAEDSLANKLSDKSYYKLAEAFGFGDYETPKTSLEDFANDILEKYQTRQFEIAVGEADETFRFALYAQRELPELAEKSSSVNSKWYSIIASEPLSNFMQTALGLPEEVASLDVDQQVEVYKKKASTMFGTNDLVELVTGGGLEKLIKAYLVRAEFTADTSTTGNSAALLLLQGSGSTTGILSLLL